MKKIISAFTLLLLVFAIPTEISGEDFDGLEGVIVLNPSDEDTKTSSNTSNSSNEGLDLTVEENTIERISETYSNIILNISLMNWDVSEYRLDDAVSAKLYYQDQFEYSATMDFQGETEIGMLVNLDGTLTFTVPNIVAMADKDSIELELKVLDETYTEELDLAADAKKVFEEVEMPFDYENRGNDELELNLGSIQIFDTWKGEKDEKYKWIVQDFSMINWSGSQKEINESLYVLLTYMDEYGFEAQVEFPQEQLDSLEMVQGNLIFHVPVIVTTAEEGTLTLQINLSDNEWIEDFDIKSVRNLIDEKAIYTPGTYTAKATGINGEITVRMTFDETKITDVVLGLSGETPSIGGSIGDELKKRILDSQTSEIDGVSGASITSNAVKEAAANCIAQARRQ